MSGTVDEVPPLSSDEGERTAAGQGREIRPLARLVAVADQFDAMVSDRPYRRAMDLRSVATEMKRSAGTARDPELVAAYEEVMNDGWVPRSVETGIATDG